MESIEQAWNALRTTLKDKFSFYDIKEIVGLAGFNLTSIAQLEQRAGRSDSKGQLMTWIDRGLNELNEKSLNHFIAIVAEEVLKRRPDSRELLKENLSRLGLSLVENTVIPKKILDTSVLAELPAESQQDLKKAAQRLRDGDLSGAISSVCGALDAATSEIYSSAGLGDPAKVSFQKRWKCSFKERGVIPKMEEQLRELGWKQQKIRFFCENFESAMNHGAYVMQTLRSNMGDVHGTKPIFKSLVFDCLKWAELMLRAIKED